MTDKIHNKTARPTTNSDPFDIRVLVACRGRDHVRPVLFPVRVLTYWSEVDTNEHYQRAELYAYGIGYNVGECICFDQFDDVPPGLRAMFDGDGWKDTPLVGFDEKQYEVVALERFLMQTRYIVGAGSPEQAVARCRAGNVAYHDSTPEDAPVTWMETRSVTEVTSE